jgi:hypothetical protein
MIRDSTCFIVSTQRGVAEVALRHAEYDWSRSIAIGRSSKSSMGADTVVHTAC